MGRQGLPIHCLSSQMIATTWARLELEAVIYSSYTAKEIDIQIFESSFASSHLKMFSCENNLKTQPAEYILLMDQIRKPTILIQENLNQE